MKRLSVILLLSILPTFAFGGIGGASDKREVIGWISEKPSYYGKDVKNIWNTTPYNKVVLILGSWNATGTGAFISPKHVLTNTHVAKGCGIGGQKECTIFLSDGSSYSTKVVAFGGKDNKDFSTASKDWSILEVIDGNFCRKDYFGYTPTIQSQGLWRAGFGGLRVLTNEDIKNIKKAYWKWLEKVYPPKIRDKKTADDIRNKKIADYNKAVDLHWGKYDIEVDNTYDSTTKSYVGSYKTFLETFEKITGKNFLYEYLDDGLTLKLIRNCGISYSGGIGIHNCQSWAGDSGSSVIKIDLKSGNQVILLHRGGERYVTSKDEYINYGPVTQNIFNEKTKALIEQAKKQCTNQNTPNQPEPIHVSERDIGSKCLESDLPSHATDGKYIESGDKKLQCSNGKNCSCAATKCAQGYYLFINSSGHSQGWCYKKKCPDGQYLNVIDGYKTDGICISDNTTPAVIETPAGDIPNSENPSSNTIQEPIIEEPVQIMEPASTNPAPSISSAENLPKIGDKCAPKDLPANAVSGRYIKSGQKKLQCENETTCSCAATKCQKNYYLVVDSKGHSQGWCRSPNSCPKGQYLRILVNDTTDGCVGYKIP